MGSPYNHGLPNFYRMRHPQFAPAFYQAPMTPFQGPPPPYIAQLPKEPQVRQDSAGQDPRLAELLQQVAMEAARKLGEELHAGLVPKLKDALQPLAQKMSEMANEISDLQLEVQKISASQANVFNAFMDLFNIAMEPLKNMPKEMEKLLQKKQEMSTVDSQEEGDSLLSSDSECKVATVSNSLTKREKDIIGQSSACSSKKTVSFLEDYDGVHENERNNNDDLAPKTPKRGLQLGPNKAKLNSKSELQDIKKRKITQARSNVKSQTLGDNVQHSSLTTLLEGYDRCNNYDDKQFMIDNDILLPNGFTNMPPLSLNKEAAEAAAFLRKYVVKEDDQN